jgi:hypothetical protein
MVISHQSSLRRQPLLSIHSSQSHNSLGSKVVSLTTSRYTISIQDRFSLSKRFKLLHLCVINNLSSPLWSSMCVRQTSFCQCWLRSSVPSCHVCVMWCVIHRYGSQRVISRSRNKCESFLPVCCVRSRYSYSTGVNSFLSVSLLGIIHAV